VDDIRLSSVNHVGYRPNGAPIGQRIDEPVKTKSNIFQRRSCEWRWIASSRSRYPQASILESEKKRDPKVMIFPGNAKNMRAQRMAPAVSHTYSNTNNPVRAWMNGAASSAAVVQTCAAA
jgi:hypothetical protein